MPFSTFRRLFAESKRIKTLEAYRKINKKISRTKWLFKCCRNYPLVKTLYYNKLDMVINTRRIMRNILNDDEIDPKPACHRNLPSMSGLDFLVSDFQYLLDLIITSIDNRVIYDHTKFNILFHLGHTLYNLLKRFRENYISQVTNEQ